MEYFLFFILNNILKAFRGGALAAQLIVSTMFQTPVEIALSTFYATLCYPLRHGLPTCYATPPTRYATLPYSLRHALLPAAPRLSYSLCHALLPPAPQIPAIHLPAPPRLLRQ